MSRRMYAGGAQPTALSAPMTNADTSLTVVSGTNYPDGSTGKAVLTLDAGLAGEEKVLYTSRTGNTFTGLTRGYDGTAAVSHSSGASVRHTISAVDLDEANAHVNATSTVHGVTGAVVGTTDTQTLTNKTLTTPTIGSFINAQHDHSNGPGGGAVAGAFLGARVTRSNVLAVTSGGTAQVVGFDTESFDGSGMHDPVTNNSRLVLNKVGKWKIVAALGYASNASGVRQLQVKRNGVYVGATSIAAANGDVTIVQYADVVVASSITDYIEVFAFQTSGGDLNTSITDTFFAAYYLGV